MTAFPYKGMVLLVFLMLIVGFNTQSIQQTEQKKDCVLNPAMDFTSCRLADDEQFENPVDEASSEYIDESSSRGDHHEGDNTGTTRALLLRMQSSYHGMQANQRNQDNKRKTIFRIDRKSQERMVAHGTTCELIPEYSSGSIFQCRNGVWTAFDPKLSDWTRVKRSTYKVISFRSCRRKCSGWWLWRDCHTSCVTNYRRDYHPTISCPTIKDTFIDKKQTEQLVKWSQATARDAEDGVISARRTSGPVPNSRLKNGTYTVSYQAKDRQGSTAICNVTFNVIERKCPNNTKINDVTFSAFTWFPHGNIFCSHGNTYGSICIFSCHPTYKMIGSSQLECQANGLWEPEKPTCTLRICPAPLPVMHGRWTACSRHTYGSSCTLACDNGYNVFGPATITCQSDETWSVPGKCQDAVIPDFECPSDISVFSLPKKQPVEVIWIMPNATDNSGDPVKVTSNFAPGEMFPVGNTTVVFQARDTSDNIAVCSMLVEVKVKFCSPLSAPSEGQISCSHGNAVGSDCLFSCPIGYRMIGNSTRTCLDAEDWSGSQPSCKIIECGQPPYIEGGNFQCADGQSYGATCSLKCNAGYSASYPLTITCESTSEWSAVGSCSDTQAPSFNKGCPDVSSYASTFGQRTYVLYPTPEVTDNSGGRVTVTSDITSGSEFYIGSTNVTFTAEDMSGNIATCTFTVTVIQIECQNPLNTDLDNSKDKVMRFSCPNGHVFGASCSITCSDKSPLGGQSTITCQQNGTSTGYWWYGNVKPFCNALACPAPVKPIYGSTACDILADRELCAVLCQEGHSFPKVELENGLFICHRTTGQWLPREISSSMCIPGRTPSGITMMPDIYYYSNNCSADSEEIKEKFIAIIDSSPIFSDVCDSKNITCTVDTVTVTCGSRAKRSVGTVSGGFMDSWNPRNKRSLSIEDDLRSGQLLLRSKRSVDTATHINKLAFEIKMSYEKQENAAKTLAFYDDLAYSLNEKLNEATASGELDIPEAGETSDHSYGYGPEQFVCEAPTLFQAQAAMCVGCGQGYISQSEACDVCPVGTYQPEDEGTECLSCPDGYSTKRDASNSSSDCLAICIPGTYSKTGLEPCDTCRRGSYQSGTGKNSCDFCPYGMSTSSDGATSKDECTFYEVKFDNVSNTLNFSRPLFSFTAVAWMKFPSDLIETQTSFSLNGNPGDASFGCGDFTVYIFVSENPESRKRRQWNHIALTVLNDIATLYVNGIMTESKFITVFCNDLELAFTTSDMLEELVISGLQMSDMVLTQEQVASMSLSCHSVLERNILVATEKQMDSLITASSCDDTDNCINSPCGSKGVCIDMKGQYRCDCDELWSGVNCEIEPDYCQGNLCENNAQCVNQVEDGNYTCVCTQEYRGRLCSEKIVHGGWSNWSEWTQCSVTCDHGTHSRSRTCDNPVQGPDGKMCEGEDEETEACFLKHCPVDGGLSEWTAWNCPVTCGEGPSTRFRECNNPASAYGGNDCVGALIEAKDCENLEPCPIDGAYGNFSDWSPCSKSCQGGITIRERTCDSPAPQYGGVACDPDQATESKPCNEEDCPVCKSLIRPRNAETMKCTYNDTEDMNECQIICLKGYLTDEDKRYICGRATNFTWSHVTPQNPRGRLPECEEATVPKTLSLDSSMEYSVDGLPRDTVVASIETKLSKTINCTNCSYKVQTTGSNFSSRRKRTASGVETTNVRSSSRERRATEPIDINVVLSVQMPNPDLDLKTASDAELEEQGNSILDFELAAQRLSNNSNYIFEVTHNNETVMPDASSVKSTPVIDCPLGTESIDGACVNCGRGYYTISVDSGCEPCPEGFYQDNIKSTSCKPCPSDTSTAGLGAISLEECVKDPSIFFPEYIKDYTDIDSFEVSEEETKNVDDDEDSNKGLIIGAVIGSVIFVLLVIAATFASFKYINRNKNTSTVTPGLFNCMKTGTDTDSMWTWNNANESTEIDRTRYWSMERL